MPAYSASIAARRPRARSAPAVRRASSAALIFLSVAVGGCCPPPISLAEHGRADVSGRGVNGSSALRARAWRGSTFAGGVRSGHRDGQPLHGSSCQLPPPAAVPAALLARALVGDGHRLEQPAGVGVGPVAAGPPAATASRCHLRWLGGWLGRRRRAGPAVDQRSVPVAHHGADGAAPPARCPGRRLQVLLSPPPPRPRAKLSAGLPPRGAPARFGNGYEKSFRG